MNISRPNPQTPPPPPPLGIAGFVPVAALDAASPRQNCLEFCSHLSSFHGINCEAKFVSAEPSQLMSVYDGKLGSRLRQFALEYPSYKLLAQTELIRMRRGMLLIRLEEAWVTCSANYQAKHSFAYLF